MEEKQSQPVKEELQQHKLKSLRQSEPQKPQELPGPDKLQGSQAQQKPDAPQELPEPDKLQVPQELQAQQKPDVLQELQVLKKPERVWYAVYTNSRAEKKVNERIAELGIETFLPLQKTLRQWSDRKKLVERPLISSYVFVKTIPKEAYLVRKVDGVVKFITIEGKPVPIPEEQITNLRILCGSDADVEVSREVFQRGDMVEVTIGSLTGLRGELIRAGRKHKVVIRIIQPGMNLTVDIQTNMIRKLEKKQDI